MDLFPFTPITTPTRPLKSNIFSQYCGKKKCCKKYKKGKRCKKCPELTKFNA